MPQETLVVQLAPTAQERLARELEGGDFEQRSVEHTRFSVKGQGVIATLYRSGKLVVQGSEVQLFATRYLGEDARAPAEPAGALEVGQATLIGSDEAGKGDYFGPLVVVAVRADARERAELARSGVADSKTLSDERVHVLAPALEQRYACAAEVLLPADYNVEHPRFGSLNPLLAELHARCIKKLHQPGVMVLVDKFADDKLIADRLRGLDLELHQRTRAEREPVVAAASVVARNLFLEGLRQLSEEFAVELHKGAGEPTDRSAREFVKLHGREQLGRVAKLHFKNTQKIRG
ncbi:MAG: ribonuclease HIII [Planctomycetes bacterium]|nr:ribonuclease HIII [Planctomycetota bacterium]